MAELADAIVQSGRETLESAIRQVEGHPEWRAQVVYGDTGGTWGLGLVLGLRARWARASFLWLEVARCVLGGLRHGAGSSRRTHDSQQALNSWGCPFVSQSCWSD